MGSAVEASADQEGWDFASPWILLTLALAILLAALAVAATLGSGVVVLVFLGLLLAGAGVALRPASPGVLGLATLSGALAYLALLSSSLGVAGSLDAIFKTLGGQQMQLPTPWDSARMVVAVLTLVSAVATILMLLPRVLRRVMVSLLVILHFGGIITSTMTVQPAPWLATMVWTHFYRPYLELAYLSNAYHFYSPEPGPASLLWFYVIYEDGSHDWFKAPLRGEPPLKLEYLRRLSLAEYAGQLMPPAPVPPSRREDRLLAAVRDGISIHMALPESLQYREPKPYSKIVLGTYARRVFHHPPNPEKRVTGVKIYRALHEIMVPGNFAADRDPEDPNWFSIFYMGEYDAEGGLKDPKDPYLYWLIPSLRLNPARTGPRGEPLVEPDGSFVFERDPEPFPYLEKHVKLHTQGTEGRN
jgi:hypothetical protein